MTNQNLSLGKYWKLFAAALNQLFSVIMQKQLLFDTQVNAALNKEALMNNRV